MKKVIWIIDSGRSRHMTGDIALLSQFEEKVGSLVTFGDNNKGFTMGYGKLISGIIVIEDVALVAGLEVNLLCVSQFTDKGFKVSFDKGECTFISKKSGEVSLKGAKKGSLFVAYLDSANEDAINTLVKKELVRDMANLEFAQDEKKRYALVMVDDYPRYTWVEFMHSKDETPHIIIEHIKKIEKQAENQNCVKRLRSDNGT
ncbi:hypothetical protein AgCh_016404 [Apium graveolens]